MDKQYQYSNPEVPTAIETERTILAKALTNKEQALELLSGTDEAYFWNLKNQTIYLAIRDIVAEGGTPDFITVSNFLKGSDAVKASDIAELIEAQFDSHAGIPQLVAILEQAATQRETLRLIAEAQRNITSFKPDVLPNLVSDLLKLSSRSVRKTTFTAKELVAEFYETLGERQRNGGIAGIPFGYRELDTYTSGMKPGQLIFVAARTSQGKSAFSENLIQNMLKNSVAVYFVSVETGRGEIMDRMVGRLTGLGHNYVMHGIREDDPNAGKVNEAGAWLNDKSFIVEDNPNITSDQILAKATQLHLQGKLDVLVVDYLQLVKDKGERGETRERTVARISQNLKSIARSLNIPVIVTAQLGRDAAEKHGKEARPELHHLRESGQLEQDADVVLLLWQGDQETEPGIAHFDIAKNRSGQTVMFDLLFNGKLVKFSDIPREQVSVQICPTRTSMVFMTYDA